MALVEVEGPDESLVSTLILNRPKARNALSVEMCAAIRDALQQVDSSASRAVVLKGSGKVFCSGADFAAVSGRGGIDFVPAFEAMLEAVARFRLPTVAAIHGAALGGGLQLAAVCDFRVAAESAKLGIPSSKLGILVNFENVQRLVLTAGIAIAKEVLMSGRTFAGAEAVHAGLVNEVVPDAELEDRAASFGAELASLAPLSVQGIKRAIQVVVEHLGGARKSSPEDAAAMDVLVAEAYASRDLQEGLSAMSEKRPPSFEGK